MGKKNVCFMCGKKETFREKLKFFFETINPSRTIIMPLHGFVDIGGKTFCSLECYQRYMSIYSMDSDETWLEEAKRQNTYDREKGEC